MIEKYGINYKQFNLFSILNLKIILNELYSTKLINYPIY